MSSSNISNCDPITRALLERAASGSLSTEDERLLETLLSDNDDLRRLLDELVHDRYNTIIIKELSQPSISISTSLDRAMSELMANVCRDEFDLPVTHAGSPIPAIDSEQITLVRKLGQGGMGVVYEGFDRQLGRSVAIKFMASEIDHDKTTRDRLLSEAQAAAQIQHENVVAIHSIHLSGRYPFIVQQFVKGESLGERLARVGKLDASELVELTKQLARGLAAAHRIGLVHRDLKPDNILIDDETNTARIADFGLAMRQDSQLSSTETCIAGTPAYMSPEQTRGDTLDTRSDLFSLGCVLYRASTGSNPFEANDVACVMENVRTKTCLDLGSLRNDLPKPWVDCVNRLLEKNPDDRIQSAESLIQMLRLLDESKPKRFTRLAVATLVFALAIIAVASLTILERNQLASDKTLAAASSPLQTEPVLDRTIWFEITGDSTHYETLEAATAAAQSDATINIHGMGLINCDSIVVLGKSLNITMDANAEVVLRPRALTAGVKEPFIRTDSPLSLTNLKIESDRRGDFELPIQSIIESSNGPLRVNRCEISGRSYAACIVVSSGEAEIINSQLRSPEGPVLVGPQSAANVSIRNCSIEGIACLSIVANGLEPSEPAAEYTVANTDLFGKCVLRMYLGRQPFIPIKMNLIKSVDTCEYQVLITTFFPRRDDLSKSEQIELAMKRTLHWNESHCVHNNLFRPLGSFGMLPNSTVRSSNLSDWNDWSNYWKLPPDVSNLSPLRVERKEQGMTVDRSTIPRLFGDCGANEKF